jgi:hypothetical protein
MLLRQHGNVLHRKCVAPMRIFMVCRRDARQSRVACASHLDSYRAACEGRYRDGALRADLQFNTCTEYRWIRENDGSDRGIGRGTPKQPHRAHLRVRGLPQDAFRRCRVVRSAGKIAPYDPPGLSSGHTWGSWTSPSRFQTAKTRRRSLFAQHGVAKADPLTGPSCFGARKNLYLERRALAYRGLDPDAPTVYLCLAMARPRPVPPLALVLELST